MGFLYLYPYCLLRQLIEGNIKGGIEDEDEDVGSYWRMTVRKGEDTHI
jgi:hypothetical protein